jgi:Tol biopolymer transport system component
MFDPCISADGGTLFFASRGLLSNPAQFPQTWQVPVETTLERARFFRLQPGYAEATLLNAPFPVGNRGSRDRGPSFSADGLSLFFCSDVSGNMDLWVTTRTSLTNAWEQPIALDTINTLADEAFPAVSADGHSLFFSDWFLFYDNQRPDGFGIGDLWVSTRTSLQEPWQPAINLGPVVNSVYSDATPTISGDGLTLIFASDRPGNVPGSGSGFSGLDLWITTRSDPSDPEFWSEPVNLGAVVNSSYADWSPNLSRDGLALYFSSDRPGLGRPAVPNNIWVARRKSVTEPFGPPVSLEPHFLEVGNMLDPCIAPDGATLLFATHGLLADPFPREFVDLWQAPVVQPPPLSILLLK